jgi:hypothetical protein
MYVYCTEDKINAYIIVVDKYEGKGPIVMLNRT